MKITRNELEVISPELEGARTEIKGMTSDLAVKQAELEGVGAELGAEKVEAEQAKVDAERAKLEAVIAELELKKVELEATKAELQAEKVEVATTKAKLKATSAKADAGRAELETVKAELELEMSELDSAKAKLRTVRAKTEIERLELKAATTELEAAKAKAEAERARLEAARTELETMRGDLKQIKVELKAAVFESEMAKRFAEKSELQVPCSEMEMAVSQVEPKREDLEVVQAEFKSARAELEAVKAELKLTRKEMEAKRGRLEAVRGEVKDNQSCSLFHNSEDEVSTSVTEPEGEVDESKTDSETQKGLEELPEEDEDLLDMESELGETVVEVKGKEELVQRDNEEDRSKMVQAPLSLLKNQSVSVREGKEGSKVEEWMSVKVEEVEAGGTMKVKPEIGTEIEAEVGDLSSRVGSLSIRLKGARALANEREATLGDTKEKMTEFEKKLKSLSLERNQLGEELRRTKRREAPARIEECVREQHHILHVRQCANRSSLSPCQGSFMAESRMGTFDQEERHKDPLVVLELFKMLEIYSCKLEKYKQKVVKDQSHLEELSCRLWDMSDNYLASQQELNDCREQLARAKKQNEDILNNITLQGLTGHKVECYPGSEATRRGGIENLGLDDSLCELSPPQGGVRSGDGRVLVLDESRRKNPLLRSGKVHPKSVLEVNGNKNTFSGGNHFSHLGDMFEGKIVSPTAPLSHTKSLEDLKGQETTALLPISQKRQKQKMHITYRKPGPPTPCKNYGRLSLQGGELPLRRSPVKHRSGTLRKLFRNTKETEAKPRSLFNLVKRPGRRQSDRENNPP